MIEDWKPRKRTHRIPYGYKIDTTEGGDPNLLIPDPAVIGYLDQALDQLDAGISLREVSEWLGNQSPEHPLSHMGLRLIWDRERPDHPKKINKPAPTKIRMTHEDRSKYRKKVKLANEKRTLAAVIKRVEKKKAELGEIERKEELPYVELPVTYEYSTIPQDEEIIFSPNAGPQTEFLAAWEQEVLYGGAAGGGKSYALLADPMRYFDNPHFNGVLLRRTNDELRELIWKSHELYPKAYPGSKWSEKRSAWTFPKGGHLWFTYLERDEDVRRYQGQSFCWVGFDELTQYPTSFAWDYLRSRLRTTSDSGLPLMQRGTTNPGGIGHGWVKRMFVDPAPENTTFHAQDIETGDTLIYPKGHAREGEPLFQRRFIPAKVQDNPYLWDDGAYERNLLSLPESQRRQLLEGDWGVAEGAAFPEFRRSLHVCSRSDVDVLDTWLKFRSCDFGYSVRQASAVHWYAMDPTYGTLYVYRELYVNQHTGTQLAQKILELEANESISYGVLDSSVWAVRGQSGPSIAEEMIKMGCRWRPSDRSAGSRVASKNRLHELLRVDPMTGKPGIIFFDTCRQIISDLPVIPVSKDSDDIDQSYPSDHAYDSIRYGIQTRPRASSWDWGSSSQTSYRPSDPVFGY